ncbi:hypothetical protein LSH36_781g02025 [Paralvinella palmiformis]|uniref:G-protein coupled receptors family 1 profile domain-containing protein n=1 Tax=Paralvinella palmiformis TaxID=53620 RepID=A0AAD9MSU4_9ANNE|nr:hypothetical protein LSH36_781g02025 [Paralvinella palmiformis]
MAHADLVYGKFNDQKSEESIIFHVEYHPHFAGFAQCVTFNFFPSPSHELAYNLFNLIAVYGLPLCVIIFSYLAILLEMTKKARQSKDSMHPSTRKAQQLRRSGVGKLEKARLKTLKMTLVIVVVFVLCWTPYFVISAWWWFDKVSAENLDWKIQRGLFLFAVSNSCANPLVYGMFTINLKRELMRCCCCKTPVIQSTNVYSPKSRHLLKATNSQQPPMLTYGRKLLQSSRDSSGVMTTIL